MGFKRERKARRIVFEPGTEFAGLELRAYGLTIEEWIETDNEALPVLFGEKLIEWNWEDDDNNPVPPTEEGIKTLDASDIRSLATHWFQKCSVRVPLDPKSTDVVVTSSNGAEIPMAPLGPDELES